MELANQTVLILDCGGQYKELISRRVRECNVYSIIKPCDISLHEIRDINPIGIIFTGGPNSAYLPDSPRCDAGVFELGIPLLGICYGMQMMTHMLGGEVKPCGFSEYGRISVDVDVTCPMFVGLDTVQQALMSHGDQVVRVPDGFRTTAHSKNCPNAGMMDTSRRFFGVQFHPEVENTPNGMKMLRNFLFDVCHAKGDYNMFDYIRREVERLREQIGDDKVLLGLSGGVDSSVCAALLSKAIGKNLICIYVDHGFMRKNESEEIEKAFSERDLRFVRVDASEQFLEKLKGVSDPETKRKIIGKEFVEVFAAQAKKYGKDVKYLAQGTIYPDVIESGNSKAATIKSHHNVGGLPKDLPFEGVVEPLRGLFKDEVRQVGRMLGLPRELYGRQPFPGPGLAIRVIGEITREKLDILREADYIFRQEVGHLRQKPDQYFAVLTNCRSVGVMGDGRTYDYTVALRAVKTNDFMTCEYAHLSHALLSRVASRIANEVRGINRVVYDITGKPPATIEWE